jgi:hypothetical protein
MRFLPLFLLFIVSVACQELDEPNVDLRIYASVGDCMPPVTVEDSTATLYTGYLNLYDRSSVLGFYDPKITPLRVHKGVLKMTLEPGRYDLRLQVLGSTTHTFFVADTLVHGPVYLKQCTSF